MKATEQLSSMEMMGVDPLRRVIAPRLWPDFFAMPLLALIFSVVGIWGGMLVSVDWLGVFEGAFWGNMQQSVDFWLRCHQWRDQSVVFGFVCAPGLPFTRVMTVYPHPPASAARHHQDRGVFFAGRVGAGLYSDRRNVRRLLRRG